MKDQDDVDREFLDYHCPDSKTRALANKILDGIQTSESRTVRTTRDGNQYVEYELDDDKLRKELTEIIKDEIEDRKSNGDGNESEQDSKDD